MKRIAIDIETSGLRPWGGKIFCCAVNDGSRVWVEPDIKKLKTVLEDNEVMKVIHNAGFDATWSNLVAGINVRNIWDTRLCEQVILGQNLPRSEKDEDVRKELSSSLEYTLVRYGFPHLQKGMGALFAQRPWDKPLTKEEIDYAKGDVTYLLKLQVAQEAVLTREGLLKVAMLENRTVEVVARMRSRGIGFDSNIWLGIAAVNETHYRELLKRMPTGDGVTPINWNSPAQVKKFFINRGVPLFSITDAEEVLEETNDEHLRKFVDMRSYFKSVTTYGRGWLMDKDNRPTVDGDGRVRCDFTQILETGRFSSDHPNLQQLPSKGLHRSAFVPAKGNVFVIGDFSGQEIGIAAAASGETLWIDAMLRGDDIHSLTASLLYKESWDNGKEKGCAFPKKCSCRLHQPLRQNAKILNFMILYGGGPKKFAAKTGLQMREASQTILKYKRVIPRLSRWLAQNAKDTVRTFESYSADPYKRRRVVRESEEWRRETVGKNNPVQACGANCLKLAMISMPEEFPIVLVIHDEIVLEVPKAKAKKAAIALKQVMEKAAAFCTGIDKLITVDPHIQDNLMK